MLQQYTYEYSNAKQYNKGHTIASMGVVAAGCDGGSHAARHRFGAPSNWSIINNDTLLGIRKYNTKYDILVTWTVWQIKRPCLIFTHFSFGIEPKFIHFHQCIQVDFLFTLTLHGRHNACVLYNHSFYSFGDLYSRIRNTILCTFILFVSTINLHFVSHIK